MTIQTLPEFTGQIREGLGETKQQSRMRNDKYAVSIYRWRPEIDKRMEDKRLREALREPFDD